MGRAPEVDCRVSVIEDLFSSTSPSDYTFIDPW